jgi:hypothetical protein
LTALEYYLGFGPFWRWLARDQMGRVAIICWADGEIERPYWSVN